jgi:hypothetical protein
MFTDGDSARVPHVAGQEYMITQGARRVGLAMVQGKNGILARKLLHYGNKGIMEVEEKRFKGIIVPVTFLTRFLAKPEQEKFSIPVILNIPKDATVKQVFWDYSRDGLVIFYEHPSFEAIGPTNPIPIEPLEVTILDLKELVKTEASELFTRMESLRSGLTVIGEEFENMTVYRVGNDPVSKEQFDQCQSPIIGVTIGNTFYPASQIALVKRDETNRFLKDYRL